jgi:hypothetical protein
MKINKLSDKPKLLFRNAKKDDMIYLIYFIKYVLSQGIKEGKDIKYSLYTWQWILRA